MSVSVYIPTPYRPHAGQKSRVEVDANSVAELLGALARTYPALGAHILTPDGGLPGHLNVYVNEVEVRSLQGTETALVDGDEVALIPAMAGGEYRPLLNREQLERYSRHIRLEEVGVAGQRKLLDSKVLIIGAGGLGSPAAVYLAAAGVGTIGIVDGDRVDLSNLQRQILHFNHDVGRPKVQSARRHIEDLNPDVDVRVFPTVITAENAEEIISPFDLVINGCDNFPTRYLLNDVCVFLGKPLIDASILKWEGQATVFLPGQGCYRCLFPAPPPPGSVPSCAEGGVVGAMAGHMGTLQAIEAIKVLLGIGEPIAGRLILYDALNGDYQRLRWTRNPQCPVCGDHPTITAPIDYEGFCGVPGPDHDGKHVIGDAPAAMDTVSPSEAWDRIQRGALVVDVREPHEYAQYHIAGARLIPMRQLAAEGPQALDPGRETIVVCMVGLRSARAASVLRELGFPRTYNLEGGMIAWRNLQLPVEDAAPSRGR